MSKFKKGDWVREDDAEPGDTMREHGYRVHDVLPNGQYLLEINDNGYVLKTEGYLRGCVVEPSCTGWDWVLPLIDGPGRYVTRNNRIVVITERRSEEELSRQGCCPDHIWRGYTTVDNSYNTYRSDGTWDGQENRPSVHDIVAKYVGPPKRATKTIVLEEWVFLSGFERSKPCSEAVFKWRPAGGHSHGTWSGWTKTGVTRELEVPNEQ